MGLVMVVKETETYGKMFKFFFKFFCRQGPAPHVNLNNENPSYRIATVFDFWCEVLCEINVC
jgi:hypothetical protein